MLAGGVGGDDEDLEPKKKRQRNSNDPEIQIDDKDINEEVGKFD